MHRKSHAYNPAALRLVHRLFAHEEQDIHPMGKYRPHRRGRDNSPLCRYTRAAAETPQKLNNEKHSPDKKAADRKFSDRLRSSVPKQQQYAKAKQMPYNDKVPSAIDF